MFGAILALIFEFPICSVQSVLGFGYLKRVPYPTCIMFVPKLKRKTAHDIAVQIVRNHRTKDGKVRQRIVRYMGTAPEDPALEALLHIAEQERLRIEEDVQLSLFPSEHSAHAALETRRRKQSDQPIPLEDIRRLVEAKRICVGFHEVFRDLYKRMGLDQLFSKRHFAIPSAANRTKVRLYKAMGLMIQRQTRTLGERPVTRLPSDCLTSGIQTAKSGKTDGICSVQSCLNTLFNRSVPLEK